MAGLVKFRARDEHICAVVLSASTVVPIAVSSVLRHFIPVRVPSPCIAMQVNHAHDEFLLARIMQRPNAGCAQSADFSGDNSHFK
jgi:hypothetical protein